MFHHTTNPTHRSFFLTRNLPSGRRATGRAVIRIAVAACLLAILALARLPIASAHAASAANNGGADQATVATAHTADPTGAVDDEAVELADTANPVLSATGGDFDVRSLDPAEDSLSADWSDQPSEVDGSSADQAAALALAPATGAALAGGAEPDAGAIQLWVNKGCGATYTYGEGVVAYFRVPAYAVYTLRTTDVYGTIVEGTWVLQPGPTYYLTGHAAPLGVQTLNLSGAGTSAQCSFTVGSAAAPQPSVTLTETFTMDQFLRRTSCIPSGQRVYFGATVRNNGSASATASVAMMTRGIISNWWMEHLDTVTLAPGETRTLYGFADGYPNRNLEYRVDVVMSAQTVASKIINFRVGGCF